jgi:hypothetical protein
VQAHIHQKYWKSVKKHCLPARKLDHSCFLGQERSAVGGIHAKRDHSNVMWIVYKILKNLFRGIQNKGPGMLTSGLVLLHDNVHPYTAAGARALRERHNWELFDHPPYSP